MNELLRNEVLKVWPTVKSRALNFAIAPNGGDPVLVVSKRDLTIQKFLSRMAKAKKAVDAAQVWFGTVAKEDDKFVFTYSPEESKGQVRVAAFRKALKVLGNDKELKIPALVKARITGPGLEDELELEVGASRKSKFVRGGYAKLESALKASKDPRKTDAQRAEAREKVRTEAASWLGKHADSDDPGDLGKRADVWAIYTALTASSGEEPAADDLPFIATMLTAQVDQLVALERTGTREELASGVDGAMASLEMFMDAALQSENDVVIARLLEQYRRAAELRDGLLDPTPVTTTEVREEITRAAQEFQRLDEGARSRRVKGLSDLRDRCSRDGLFAEVEQLSDLLEMTDKPWTFEDTGEFVRRYRIDLAEALADAGKHDSDMQAALLRGWREQCLVLGDDDPGLRLQFPVIELAYGVQMLKESHPALWDIIESALEDGGEGRGQGAVPAALRRERLERMFAHPLERRLHAEHKEQIEQESRTRIDRFSYEEYDERFDPERKRQLQDIVETAGSAPQVLTAMLGDEEGVALSEEHSRGDVKKLIIDSLDDLVDGGLDTLYIEHFRCDEHQVLLDQYMETGEEPRALKDYLDAQKKRHNPGEESGAPAHKDIDLRAILLKAWQTQLSSGKKLRIVGIDSMDAKADPDGPSELWGAQRTQRMNGLADKIIGGDEGRTGKYLILAGGEHNNTHEGGSRGVPGLGQLRGVPVLALEGTGQPKLEWDDEERRHAQPVKGGKAVLVAAKMGAVAKIDDGTILGHGMPMAMKLSVPEQPTGADYTDGGFSALSVYGARLEWWERIEWVWDFKVDDPKDLVTVRRKKEAGEGGSVKPWGDLYTAKPRASTYREWVNAVDAAGRGELQGTTTITVTDKPAISLISGWFSKRVLRFRIVVTDENGKREVTEATQVCVAEDGKAAYAYYSDTAGNQLVWKDPGFDESQIADEEREVRFSLEEDLPNAKWESVSRLLEVVALGAGTPFEDKEEDFLRRVIAETGTTRSLRDLNQDFIKQAYCALPVLPSSERYVQLPAEGGGLLVARVKSKEVLALHYTNNTPTKPQLLVVQQPSPPYETRRYEQPGRAFVEMPIERVRALMGGDR